MPRNSQETLMEKSPRETECKKRRTQRQIGREAEQTAERKMGGEADKELLTLPMPWIDLHTGRQTDGRRVLKSGAGTHKSWADAQPVDRGSEPAAETTPLQVRCVFHNGVWDRSLETG